MDETITNAIMEYLHYKDFKETLEVLEGELDKKVQGTQTDLSKTPQAAVMGELLDAFDTANSEAFFHLWNKHVPLYVRDKDMVARKLEFYLNIRFALAPWQEMAGQGRDYRATPPPDATGAMTAFKTYLTTRGQYLAQTSEFLAYYALPYVPNPLDHPSFQPLFHPEWLVDLRGRFMRFINVILRSVQAPELYDRFSSDTVSTEQLRARFASRENRLRLYGYSVLAVGEELATMLQAAVEGGAVFPAKQQCPELIAAAYGKFKEFRGFLDSQEDVPAPVHGASAPAGSGSGRPSPDMMLPQRGTAPAGPVPSISSPERGANVNPYSRASTASGAGEAPGSAASRSRARAAASGSPGPAASTGGYSAAVNASTTNLAVTPGVAILSPRAAEVALEEEARRAAELQAEREARLQQAARARTMDRGVKVAALNYAKIKADLRTLIQHSEATASAKAGPGKSGAAKAVRRSCLLLQALRWRLVRSKPGRSRRWVLHTYINNDLLECVETAGDMGSTTATVAGGRRPLLRKLLRCTQPRIRDSAARLVNAISSESAGRSYMLANPDVIQWLVSLMKHEVTDSPTRQNALGALQKFSLRRLPQTIMIDKGCIEWLVGVLKNHLLAMGTGGHVNPLTEYSVEYSTALLMNLSLRTRGKEHAAADSVDILDMLADFLESENPQVRTYINGTLYSVLAHPALKDRALTMKLDEILTELMQHCEDPFQRQLQYCLEQITAPVDDIPSDEEDEDDDDDDGSDSEMEEEEEEDDELELQALPDEPSGEDLLCAAYLADGGGGDAARREAQHVESTLAARPRGRSNSIRKGDILGDKGPQLRPMTPSTSSSSRKPPPAAMRQHDRISRTPPLQVQLPPDDDGMGSGAGTPARRHSGVPQGTGARMGAAVVDEEYKEIFQTRSKLARTPGVPKHYMPETDEERYQGPSYREPGEHSARRPSQARDGKKVPGGNRTNKGRSTRSKAGRSGQGKSAQGKSGHRKRSRGRVDR